MGGELKKEVLKLIDSGLINGLKRMPWGDISITKVFRNNLHKDTLIDKQIEWKIFTYQAKMFKEVGWVIERPKSQRDRPQRLWMLLMYTQEVDRMGTI
ncbi:hypothetical protein ACE3NQ_08615 [Paenibacillus terreus]|uniref:Uncharacterized protein n=1 Tax=Paenibacillus terreus TaxID=1387834 RepID=A0ABV5B5P2_9BACL